MAGSGGKCAAGRFVLLFLLVLVRILVIPAAAEEVLQDSPAGLLLVVVLLLQRLQLPGKLLRRRRCGRLLRRGDHAGLLDLRRRLCRGSGRLHLCGRRRLRRALGGRGQHLRELVQDLKLLLTAAPGQVHKLPYRHPGPLQAVLLAGDGGVHLLLFLQKTLLLGLHQLIQLGDAGLGVLLRVAHHGGALGLGLLHNGVPLALGGGDDLRGHLLGGEEQGAEGLLRLPGLVHLLRQQLDLGLQRHVFLVEAGVVLGQLVQKFIHRYHVVPAHDRLGKGLAAHFLRCQHLSVLLRLYNLETVPAG